MVVSAYMAGFLPSPFWHDLAPRPSRLRYRVELPLPAVFGRGAHNREVSLTARRQHGSCQEPEEGMQPLERCGEQTWAPIELRVHEPLSDWLNLFCDVTGSP